MEKNLLDSFYHALADLSYDRYLSPENLSLEARTLLPGLQGEEFCFARSEQGKEIPGFCFGSGDIFSFWYGFPNPLSALGGLTCLTLMKMVQQFPDIFRSFRFCVVPCLDPDGAEQNQALFSGVEEMYTFAQHYYWNPEREIAWDLTRTETKNFLEYLKKNAPAYVFPLIDECISPIPKLTYFVFGAPPPDKKMTHAIRDILKKGNQSLHQILHPALGKGGFFLNEYLAHYGRTHESIYSQFLDRKTQIFWAHLSSAYSEEIKSREMSPYTEIETALEEKALAQKIEKELLCLIPETEQETPYSPVLRYYRNWCKKKQAVNFTEEQLLGKSEDLPHLTLGEWRVFQAELGEHIMRLGVGLRHLEAIHTPIEAYELEFLELMDAYKKHVPFGRLSPGQLVRTQLLCNLKVLTSGQI